MNTVDQVYGDGHERQSCKAKKLLGVTRVEEIIAGTPPVIREYICQLFADHSARIVAERLRRQFTQENDENGPALPDDTTLREALLASRDLLTKYSATTLRNAVGQIAITDMECKAHDNAVHKHRSEAAAKRQTGRTFSAESNTKRVASIRQTKLKRKLEAGMFPSGGRDWTREEIGHFVLLLTDRNVHKANNSIDAKSLATAMTNYATENGLLEKDCTITAEQIRQLKFKLKTMLAI